MLGPLAIASKPYDHVYQAGGMLTRAIENVLIALFVCATLAAFALVAYVIENGAMRRFE